MITWWHGVCFDEGQRRLNVEEKEMKLSKVLSVFALVLAPMLAGAVTMGCSSGDPTSQSDNVTELTNYEINVERMNEQYPDVVPIKTAADAWTALVKVGDQVIPAPTHLFGEVVNIVPYSNEDGQKDAAGAVFERGDMVIAKIYKPGQVGIAVKMHRPEKRFLDLNNADAAAMKEDFKLQDTHIEVVVGVERAEHGKAGAITLNNPQGYEEGAFGDEEYSMIFLSPAFPEWVPAAAQAKYNNNIRSILVGLNAVTNFPGDYNGGDPLAGNTPEKVTEYTRRMVLAIAGDEDSLSWFKDDANKVYCAELGFLAFSAGLITALNQKTMEPLVGAEVWAKFAAEVELHNKGVDEFAETGSVSQPSRFVELNDNKRVQMVRIDLAPDDLEPMAVFSPNPELARTQLALSALTMADIVMLFMKTHLPREILGEALAPVQAAVLAKMKPGLLETMGMDRVPENDPSRVAVEGLFAQIVEAVGKSYADYASFRAALEPLMEAARGVTGPRPGDESGTGLFVPPSLFHVAAQGQFHGLIGFQYEGHGVHITNVQQKAGIEPTPDPVEPPSATCAHDLCVEGEALTASNCTKPAARDIASADAYCENTSWDSYCVAAAKAAGVCGE
jgi:hypothetical protein